MNPPYLIEVPQENIGEIIRILKDNKVFCLVNITTVLGDKLDGKEVENLEQDTSKKCSMCGIRLREFSKVECEFCKKDVCFNDSTISFLFRSIGNEVCKKCHKLSENDIIKMLKGKSYL